MSLLQGPAAILRPYLQATSHAFASWAAFDLVQYDVHDQMIITAGMPQLHQHLLQGMSLACHTALMHC